MRISGIGVLLGEPARARILNTLLDGRARTATELTWAADITPFTVSSHLKKLHQAKLVALDRQGRHHYCANLLHSLESQAIVMREHGTRQVTVSPSGRRWLKRHVTGDGSREALQEPGR